MPLALAHLALLGLWGGVVLAEVVLELAPRRRPELARATATLHYFIDVLVEAPLLVGVVGTGVALLFTRTIDARLVVKVAAGGVAVLANAVCIANVVRRHHGGDDALPARSRVILLSAVFGMPCAALAFVLGALRVGWLSWR